MTVISVDVLIERAALGGFEARFRYIQRIRLPFTSEYVGYSVLVCQKDPAMYTIRIQQKGGGEQTHVQTELQGVRHLAQFVEAVYAVDSVGIGLTDGVRLTIDRSTDELLLYDWAHTYLCVSALEACGDFPALVRKLFTVAIPDTLNDCQSIADWLVWCRLHNGGDDTTGASHEWVPMGSDCDTPQLSSSDVDSIEIDRCIAYRSISGLVSKIHAIKPHQRLDVYKLFLRINSIESTIPDSSSSSALINECFARRFCELVGNNKLCPFSDEGVLLSSKFINHTLVENHGEELLRFLALVDPPVYELVKQNSACEIAIQEIFQSFLACTVCDSDLLIIWDTLLIDSPAVLVKLVGLCLSEVRELLIEAESDHQRSDVILTMGDLIENISTSILPIAVANDGVFPLLQ